MNYDLTPYSGLTSAKGALYKNPLQIRRIHMLYKVKLSGARVLLFTAVLGLFLSLASAPPSALAASFGWAYLWADQASTTSEYTPSSSYQFDSNVTTAAPNTVLRTGVGAYTAKLPNLGDAAGTVHVTAYGSGTETCKVANWNPSGTTQQINVRCFTNAGTPVDTRFTLTYAHPSSSPKPMAYLWADQASATSEYTPSASYQFNSTGAANTVVRTGVGTYTAKLPGVGSATGHVQVTAYGTGSERCKVVNWSPSGTTQQVNVKCFTSAGTAGDTRFTLTYVSGISIVGSTCCGGGPGTPTGYDWADQPTSSSYTPSLPYQFNVTVGAINTITRSGVGAYAAQFPFQSLDRGDVQVTAYGSASEYCKVASWALSSGVQVRCFNSAGAPVDTRFDVTFLSSYLIG
jgi:hypothetical protein